MLIKFKRIFSIISVAAIFLSCNSGDPFYSEYSREDLYRLPLLKPYELLNQYGADSRDLSINFWALNLFYNKFYGYIDQLNVSHIQVVKGVIYGHGKDGTTPSPNYWFVIIPEKKVEKLFKKEDEWTAFLKQQQINPVSLYKVWPVFNQYRSNATLPWYQPMK